jgi:hypothetical protein
LHKYAFSGCYSSKNRDKRKPALKEEKLSKKQSSPLVYIFYKLSTGYMVKLKAQRNNTQYFQSTNK